MARRLFGWLLFCAALAPAHAWPDEIDPAASNRYQFLSGTVTAIGDGAVVVRRTLAGKAPETRRFLVTAETRIEGKLQPQARVTVAYVETADGDAARRILVRAPAKVPPKPPSPAPRRQDKR